MLRAGFAKLDITPGRECGLLGYEFRQQELPPGNAGVHDPLHARVLVLNDGRAPAALASLDLCVLETDLARALRQAVAKKLKTGAERVSLCCSHTHSGPFPRLAARAKKDAGVARRKRRGAGWLEAFGPASFAYAEFLQQQLTTAAAQAAGLLYPVTLSVQEAPLGLGYNRRVRLPDGVKHCWNPQEFPDRAPEPLTDPTCTVALLRQTNGPRSFLLWGIGVHPVTLGKTSRVVSADYPGLACRMLEEELPGCRPQFFLGAAGDAHPWIATQEDPTQVRYVARAAASFVALLAQATREVPCGEGGIRTAAKTCRIGGHELDLTVWRLGALWFVAVPVELFGELGAQIRRGLKGPVLLASCANGWHGYWPTKAACAEGGYEVARGFRAGDGERLVEEVLRLAKGLA